MFFRLYGGDSQHRQKIAFADASLGEIKVSDKLRALDQYRAMCERRNDGGEISLVVNYDYGE